MFGPVRSDRRIVGRPREPGLHRDAAAGGRCRAIESAVLAGAAGGDGKPQRRTDALADREHAEHRQPARSACFGLACLGSGAVPGAWISARPLEHCA